MIYYVMAVTYVGNLGIENVISKHETKEEAFKELRKIKRYHDPEVYYYVSDQDFEEIIMPKTNHNKRRKK